MTEQHLLEMYDDWMRMWNGDLSIATELVAPGCVIHQPPNAFAGPEGIAEMVRQGRAAFSEITFSIEVTPIVKGNRLAARWIGRGRYAGGFPDATVDTGTSIEFRGNDIWRVEDGKVAEYWVSSDGIHLLTQLGVLR
jgi:predicted ester cyclase